jgi:hypothetical protein
LGLVIDFLAFLRGRKSDSVRSSAVRAVKAPPKAAFNEAAMWDALARLDAASAREVMGLGARTVASCLSYGTNRREEAHKAMESWPSSAWILSMDGDGHIREAALNRLHEPPTSAGRFVSIVLRLNDWVPQVRAAAMDAAGRLWSGTSAQCIATAAPHLLKQRFEWKRWNREAIQLDEVLARPDVEAALGRMFMDGQAGPLGMTLRHALRLPAFDSRLEELATEARLPSVRAVALKTALTGHAVWTVGYGWEWVDKVYGLRRRVSLTNSRRITSSYGIDLLRRGLKDRSASVRKIAADALIERREFVPNGIELAANLANDKSPAVRERGEFLLRHLKGNA